MEYIYMNILFKNMLYNQSYTSKAIRHFFEMLCSVVACILFSFFVILDKDDTRLKIILIISLALYFLFYVLAFILQVYFTIKENQDSIRKKTLYMYILLNCLLMFIFAFLFLKIYKYTFLLINSM